MRTKGLKGGEGEFSPGWRGEASRAACRKGGAGEACRPGDAADADDSCRELRERNRAARDAMSPAEASERSERLCGRLLSADWYAGAAWIYGYFPLGGEADVRPFLQRAIGDGKRVALPRTGEGRSMEFYEVGSLDALREGRFHVMEPVGGMPLREKKAVAVVPGVAFDRRGNRCGHGMGYYDRYLSRFPGLLKVGAAFACQVEDRIEAGPLDVPMDMIVTEEWVLDFR